VRLGILKLQGAGVVCFGKLQTAALSTIATLVGGLGGPAGAFSRSTWHCACPRRTPRISLRIFRGLALVSIEDEKSQAVDARAVAGLEPVRVCGHAKRKAPP